MLVFMAGAITFGALQARMVVVSMSSAMPAAIFPMTLAVAGATMKTSALAASDTCPTLNSKLRSKVSTMHLFPVSVSKVTGVINWQALRVMMTCTSACALTSIEARFAILYAAILPLTPRSIVFPLSIQLISLISNINP